MATLTPCEQNAVYLAEAKAALHALLTGKRVVDVRHADKGISYYGAGQVGELRDLIRYYQGLVDACNGVRGQRAFRVIPAGW